MNKRFNLFGYTFNISVGNSYWGNEPTPLKASWRLEVEIDYHNEAKRQYNYDLTKILTPEMQDHWVALAPLNKSVVDYDLDLMKLSERVKAKGVEATYMRYSNHYWHL